MCCKQLSAVGGSIEGVLNEVSSLAPSFPQTIPLQPYVGINIGHERMIFLWHHALW